MSVYEKDLMPAVSREVGDLDSSNYRYTSDVLFTAINAGVEEFNLQTPTQQYSVIGTGANAYFSPDPDLTDKRLIVLFAALALINADIAKAARSAISHSNPAGSTNLTQIPVALTRQAERIENRIATAFELKTKGLVDAECSGSELRGAPTEQAEGLGTTNLEETV